MRAADYTEDGRKDPRRRPRRCEKGTPRLEKASPCRASEPDRPLVKTSKHLEHKRERGGHKYSEKEKKQASKGADRVHYGNSKTDPRSEKHGRRKGESAKSSAETRSSKRLKTNATEDPQACERESQYPSDKKRSGKEKTKPVSGGDIWEEGIKVKPQKRISINISLDGRKKEEKQDQTEVICPESSTEKQQEEVQKSSNGGEDKVNEMEVSREQGGEAKEEINPDEKQQSSIWKGGASDHQDQVTEEREKKRSWHCAFRDEEEEEEESQGLQEENDGMKPSIGQVVTTSEMSTEREGRSGGQGRRELLPGETTSMQRETQEEGKERMETKDGTRSMDKDEESKAELSLWSVSNMEKSAVSLSHWDTAPSSGKYRSYSSSTEQKREMENDRSRQKQKEGSQDSRREGENHGDRERERSKRNLRDDQGKFQDTQLHQCFDSLSIPSNTYKDKAAGNHQPQGWLSSEGMMNRSENNVTAEKKEWMGNSTDNVAKVCGLQGDHINTHLEEKKKKGGRRWDVCEVTKWELEDGERPSSSSASQESSNDCGSIDKMKQRRDKMDKSEAPKELLEEREEHKQSKKGKDGREY